MGGVLSAERTVVARPRVRGHDGIVWQTGRFIDVRCLSWRERADLGVSVCSRGAPAPLAAAELVRIAEGLRSVR